MLLLNKRQEVYTGNRNSLRIDLGLRQHKIPSSTHGFLRMVTRMKCSKASTCATKSIFLLQLFLLLESVGALKVLS